MIYGLEREGISDHAQAATTKGSPAINEHVGMPRQDAARAGLFSVDRMKE